MRFSLVAVCICLSLAGCQDTEAQRAEFQKAIAKVTEKNRQLEARLDESTKQLQANGEKFASLEGQWKQFEAAFLPEQRQALEQNAKQAQQILTDLQATKEMVLLESGKAREGMAAEVKATKEAGAQTLATLRTTVDETSKLKEQVLQHAKQANDADLVGTLKDSVAKLDQSVQELSKLDTRVKKAERDVNNLESQVSQVQSTAQQAKSAAQRAQSDVSSLRSRIR